jgi:hypothetical protein
MKLNYKKIHEKENLYSSEDWSKFNLALKKYREKFVEYEQQSQKKGNIVK